VWFVTNGSDGRSGISRFYSVSNGRDWIRAQVQKIKNGISQAQLGGFDPKAVQDLTNTLFPSSAYARCTQRCCLVLPAHHRGM
jgi:hypothetical protein